MKFIVKTTLLVTLAAGMVTGGALVGYASIEGAPTNETGAAYLARSEGISFSGTYRYDCPLPNTPPIKTGVCVYGTFYAWNKQAGNLEGTQQGYGFTRLARISSPDTIVRKTNVSQVIYPGDTLWASGLKLKVCRDRPIVADCVEKLYARTKTR